MCNRVSIPSSEDILAEAPYLQDFIQEEVYHLSAFTPAPLPVQLSEEPYVIRQGEWGLIPDWVGDPAKFQYSTCNAVAEKIFETPSYKKYIRSQRALLWVNGFYEFQHRDSGRLKVPYYIYMPGKRPFTLGCVYNHWHDRITVSVITVPANKLLTEIHNTKERMPLIIAPEDREAWLGNLTDAQLFELMETYPDGELLVHPVSRDIVKRGYDANQPGTQAEVVY